MHISDMYITPKYISTYQNISAHIKSTDKLDKKYRQTRYSRLHVATGMTRGRARTRSRVRSGCMGKRPLSGSVAAALVRMTGLSAHSDE